MKMTRTRALVGAAVIANPAWLGGLMRLLGEAVGRGASELTHSLGGGAAQLVLTFAVAGLIVLLLLLRWPWYRNVLRQTQADVRAVSGLPTDAPPGNWRSISAASFAAVIPAVVVAALLPGVIAAATAMVVGLIARVALVTARAT